MATTLFITVGGGGRGEDEGEEEEEDSVLLLLLLLLLLVVVVAVVVVDPTMRPACSTASSCWRSLRSPCPRNNTPPGFNSGLCII